MDVAERLNLGSLLWDINNKCCWSGEHKYVQSLSNSLHYYYYYYYYYHYHYAGYLLLHT